MADEPRSVVEEALARFQLAQEADSEWRALSLNDLEFSVGDQWPLNYKTQREKKNKPCLVMDQTQQSIRQVCNEYRQQRPAIQINPIGDGADVDTAEILQGIVRHVEVNSDAEIAYDGCHEQVVRTGFGSFRLLSDYVDDETDEQEIFILPIRNQFSVFWQPGVPQEKARWAFIIEDVPLETYMEDYKDSKAATFSEFTAMGNAPAGWATKEYVRVAEYFTVEDVKNGSKRAKKQVRWRKINALEVLEGGEAGQALPGTSIPILTCYGDDLDVNGKRFIAGLVRNAKDPQRMYNYWTSKATEAIALAPTAPWVAVEGSLAGYETLWERANSGDVQVLTYKQVDVGGKPAPPPQRNTVEPPIQAMTLMIRQASVDVKASMGLYNPSLGQRTGDESGKAIEKLQQQGDVATLNYSDNMARVMRRAGRLLLEWVRAIYDAPRVQRTFNPDGTVRHVVIHNGYDQEEAAKKLLTDKIKKIYDIGVGRYDVTVSVGPSYQTKRQEAVATQLQLLKMLPQQIAPNVLDLMVRNMDIPQSKEIADRLKKLLPPQLQDGDDGDPTVRVNKLQAQLQQMSQQHELLTKALGDATEVIKTKKIESDTKLEVEKIHSDTQIAVAEIGTKAQLVNERIAALEKLMQDFGRQAHERALSAQEHGQALERGDQSHQQALEQGAQQQADQGQQELQPAGVGG